jgi:hypothetical protein
MKKLITALAVSLVAPVAGATVPYTPRGMVVPGAGRVPAGQGAGALGSMGRPRPRGPVPRIFAAAGA